MSQKAKIKSIKDIQEERLRITEKRRAIEDNMFSFSSVAGGAAGTNFVFTIAKNFVFNRFFRKRSKKLGITSRLSAQKKGTGLLSLFKASGLTAVLSQLFTHPTAKTALSLTRKSFIKWQLFNLSIILIRWGYKAYQKRRLEKKYEDAVIVED